MNRSEELAKLLGIEPKKTKEQNCKNIIKEKYPNHPKCNGNCMYCNCPLEGKCSDYEIVREVYPDFTKPSNFVKLLELSYKFNFLDFIIPRVKTTYTEDLINEAIKCLTRCGKTYQSINDFKQQARATKWTY